MPAASDVRDEFPGSAVSVLAPAKINLWLHILGRRPDGYHRLDSLVAFAALGDVVTAAPAKALSLAVSGPFAPALPAGDDNLVLKAARALAREAGISAGARLVLDKRLPVAAGIGGGSADAAAALTALGRLWQVQLSPERLAALGLQLGADVPVCLAGTPSHVGGIGELIRPAPALPETPLLLVNPGVSLGTAAVFKARAETEPGFGVAAAPWTSSPADVAELAARLGATRNDLTAAACRLAPAIAEVLERLARLPGCRLARMSGSGATCFGLFDSAAAAEAGAATLAEARPGWWVAATCLRPGRAG